MAEKFGPEMRRLRLAAGWSLSRLADEVHYHKSHLSKIENGVQLPSPEFARAVDNAFKAKGGLAGLAEAPAPARGRRAGRAPRRPGDGVEVVYVARDGAGGFADRFAWPAAGGPDAGHDHYEWYRLMFDMLRGRGQATAPSSLLPHLILHTRELEAAAGAATGTAGPPLWQLAARYAEYTGWMAQESGNDEHARYWTDRAVELADEGGDRSLRGYALVRRAELAMYQLRHEETVALAQQAQRLDCGSRVRGLAAQREAQGYAIGGSVSQCHRALERAERWLSEPETRGPLPALGTTNVTDLNDMAAGFSLVDLGDAARAAGLLRDQLERTPPYAYRMRARIGARYALALVGVGDVERGCAEARRVLQWCAATGSATIAADLRRLSRELNRWSSRPHVRELLPELAAAVAGY
ncbi:helix-turn-helix transcriptional regulator [Dactylosporangium sp. NPDC049140]|uniref:helix-turn-helix transcriptional regulator n=1 Tax=Dactylosporangium sp. NPDC049140 TaxID=3155647 RepID=UPI0033E52266